jgi:hypothetical protein
VDYEIVPFPERKNSVSGLEDSLPLADINELVSLRIAIEVRVILVRLAVQHRDVLVEKQRDAIQREAASLLRARRQEVTVVQRLVRIGLELHLAHPPHGFHRRRGMNVIEQR